MIHKVFVIDFPDNMQSIANDFEKDLRLEIKKRLELITGNVIVKEVEVKL